MVELVLASASPRRRRLIALLGYPYRLCVADVDEASVSAPSPAEDAKATALLKARHAARALPDPAATTPGTRPLLIASDTNVALDDLILGKPQDDEDARRILRLLRGRTHQVHTAVAIVDLTTGDYSLDVTTAHVTMRNYRDHEVDAYVASGDPLDKAGAYAIQNDAFRPVAHLDGCYTAVIGLSLCQLTVQLEQHDVARRIDWPALARTHRDWPCPILTTIRNGT